MRVENISSNNSKPYFSKNPTGAISIAAQASISDAFVSKTGKQVKLNWLKKIYQSLLAKNKQPTKPINEISPKEIQKVITNNQTKDNYIKKLQEKGFVEDKDFKIFDFDSYKAIEEHDSIEDIDRVIRFRNDGSISLIAEYNATTKRLIKIDKYDELGNLKH